MAARSKAVLGLVPAEESEGPGEAGAEDGSFDGTGKLAPCEMAVQEGFEENVEEGVDDKPGEEESPGWFVFHPTPWFM